MIFFSFLSWFRPWWKTSETDYETVLSRLSKDITMVQTRLVRINQRERRASVTLTLYAILLWLLYAVVLWYWSADKRLAMSKGERFKLWSPVLLGLLIIISTRTLVRWWYARIARGEETHLRSLQRTRRKKIDEIKQATRYDHLRSLLEKYDDTAPVKQADDASGRPSGRARGSSRATKTDKVPPSTPGPRRGRMPEANPAPSTGPSLAINDVVVDSEGKPVPETGALGLSVRGKDTASQLQSQSQTQLPRTWLDRVADKILGAEAGGQQVAAEQRYALICRICFTHNGLCPKEDWQEIQYICPRCGTFNSRRPSSTPVSKPWAASPSAGHQSPESSSLMSPSPSPSRRPLSTRSFGSSSTKETDQSEEHEEAGDVTQEDEEEEKDTTLRSRRANGAKEGLEDMEVD